MTTRSIQQFICVLLSVALLMGGLAPPSLLAQTADEPPAPTGIRFDAPPYAIDGPYAVGVRYFTIPAETETDRELTASVWYPALNPEGLSGEMVYEQQFEPGKVPPFSVLGHALLEAEPDESGGPYPLVVYSHAHWSMAQEIPYFVEHLASRGFVIISADHQDNWSTFPGPMDYQAVVRRSQEVSRQIDFAEDLSLSDSSLSGMIATERVGIAGWSRGGVTAWSAAGARLDLPNLRAWCTADPLRLQSPSAGLSAECVDILEHEAEMAEFDGLDEVPSGLWPSWQDERIAAAIPLSGRTASFGSEGIKHVNVPVLMFHGSHEAQIAPGQVLGNPYENMGSPRKASVVFEHAGHALYNSSCAAIPDLAAMFPGFCVDPVWDTDRAHDLINHFSTAFFQAELKGDEEAAAALASDQVSFPGVEYREQGYGAAPEPVAVVPQGLRPDAPFYGMRGPHAVGTRDITVENGEDSVSATMWYPTSNATNVPEETTYTISEKNGYFPGFPVEGRAVRNAVPDIENGPYPLVVFWTGAAAWRQMNSYLTEHLASQGFVVIAADPRGEFPGDFWQGAATRVQDTTLLIDYAEGLQAADGEWAGLIDSEQVAVVGWSSGGWAALAAGGARFDYGWCDANPDFVAEHEDSDCNQFVPHLSEIAAMLGLEPTPEGMWPSLNDPRVDAIIALAPDGDIWGAEYQGVAVMDTPVLLMTGSVDAVNVPEMTTYPIYEQAGSAKKGLITFNGAGHMMFGNQCRETPWMEEEFFWGCSDSVWDMDRAHDLINHFATAFLMAELKGDEEAAIALSPDQVSFPGVAYRAQGYSSLPAKTVAEIEAIVEKAMTDFSVPGFAMCIVQDGDVVYSKGFGVTEVGGSQSVTPETIFEVRSISKPMSAMAIMQLVEEGLIDLDGLVTEYLPDLTTTDARYADMTVRMLLSHTSGMPMGPWPFPLEEGTPVLDQIVQYLAEQELAAAPGEQWMYSNQGYSLVGQIIAQVSGVPFEAYMQEHLLAPLGMAHATFVPADIPEEMLAKPHIDGDDGSVVVGGLPYDPRVVSARHLNTNCMGMTRWAQAMLNGGELDGVRILQPSAIETIWTGESPTPYPAFLGEWYGPIFAEYGLGWFVGEKNGHRLVGHTGGGDGYNAQIEFAPDDDLVVITLSNWLEDPEANWFPAAYAAYAAFDVLYALLGITPE